MKVLELGCGNSQLCDELYKDGIVDITCIDLSSVAVEKMQTRLLSKGYKGNCFVSLYSLASVFPYSCIDCELDLVSCCCVIVFAG